MYVKVLNTQTYVYNVLKLKLRKNKFQRKYGDGSFMCKIKHTILFNSFFPLHSFFVVIIDAEKAMM